MDPPKSSSPEQTNPQPQLQQSLVHKDAPPQHRRRRHGITHSLRMERPFVTCCCSTRGAVCTVLYRPLCMPRCRSVVSSWPASPRRRKQVSLFLFLLSPFLSTLLSGCSCSWKHVVCRRRAIVMILVIDFERTISRRYGEARLVGVLG